MKQCEAGGFKRPSGSGCRSVRHAERMRIDVDAHCISLSHNRPYQSTRHLRHICRSFRSVRRAVATLDPARQDKGLSQRWRRWPAASWDDEADAVDEQRGHPAHGDDPIQAPFKGSAVAPPSQRQAEGHEASTPRTPSSGSESVRPARD